MARVIVFDVIETMLDLRALDAPFERVFGDGSVRQQWFNQMLQLALVATITDAYQDFGAIGRAALEMVAAQRGTTLADEQRTGTLELLLTAPVRDVAIPGDVTVLTDPALVLASVTLESREEEEEKEEAAEAAEAPSAEEAAATEAPPAT